MSERITKNQQIPPFIVLWKHLQMQKASQSYKNLNVILVHRKCWHAKIVLRLTLYFWTSVFSFIPYNLLLNLIYIKTFTSIIFIQLVNLNFFLFYLLSDWIPRGIAFISLNINTMISIYHALHESRIYMNLTSKPTQAFCVTIQYTPLVFI